MHPFCPLPPSVFLLPDKLLSKVRPYFHWDFSNWFIALLIALWVGALSLGAALDSVQWIFLPAYFFIVLAGVFSLGSWLTSERLSRKKPVKKSEKKKSIEKFEKAQLFYLRLQTGISLGLVLIFGVFIYGTHWVARAKDLNRLDGVLVPADDRMPKTCDSLASAPGFRIYFGNNLSISDRRPMAIIRYRTERLIWIDRDDSGRVVLNADIKSPDGRVIVRIDKNHFYVNGNNVIQSMFSRPDESTLVIKDQYDNDFRVHYLNKNALEFSGTLYVGGEPLRVAPDGVHWRTNLISSTCMGGDYESAIKIN